MTTIKTDNSQVNLNLLAENKRLKAENESLRKDAERYQWLRKNAEADSDKSMVLVYNKKTNNLAEPINCLDEQIDEAMKGE